MPVRPFRADDAPALASLSAECLRGEGDFVLNPLWETEAELFAEFDRHGIDPAEHLLVAEAGDGSAVGLVGFLRRPGSGMAGLVAPVVESRERGRGHGGELLRAALEHGRAKLGIELVTAGIGTRNRAGYSLLTAHGFRPVRQHFLMRCDAAPDDAPSPVEGVTFAHAGPEDVSGILDLYARCGFDPRTLGQMETLFGDERHVHAVARRDGGGLAAFVEIETHWPSRVWLAFVGVDPELRGAGLGSALSAWTLHRQWKRGARSALLLLSPANRTAFRAYEKVGFRRHRTFDVLEKIL